jgi:hypothetical protein
MTAIFWSNDPTILFNKESMLQLWPTQKMTFEAKLNAISRLIIVISILGFLFTRNFNLLIFGIITLAIIFTLYRLRKQKLVSSLKKEGFSLNSLKNSSSDKVTTNPITMDSLLRSNFHPTTKKNPFGNVLLTDINDTPNRLAAAPSFNPDVYEDIMNATKKQTQMLNPGIINTNKQLFGDLYENYVMDNSMMRFYSTANSRIASDQGAFSQYLYGNMPSSKESNAEGAMQRVKNAERYLLI